MARPVGRPSLPYETRHVMLNLRTEYYVKLKNQGKNMSLLVNDFLHALHEYTICPLCHLAVKDTIVYTTASANVLKKSTKANDL